VAALGRVGVLAVFILLVCHPAAAGDWVCPANLAGSWYPAESGELQRSVDAYLAAGREKSLPGRLIALVAPHAGHAFSGRAAGAAWAQAARLNPSPRTVILLGPAHRYPLERPSIWPQGAYASPLGEAAIDQALSARLTEGTSARFVRAAHLGENSLEVEIPFMRRALPAASLVAILTGPPDLLEARLLGRQVAQAARGRSVLLVASTDFSHYHDLDTARVLDGRAAARIAALDPEGLAQLAARGQTEACGLQALLAVMYAARELGAEQGVILDKDDSARVTGDRRRVVGYMAAAFVSTKERAGAGQDGGSPSGMQLGEKQRRMLKDLARRSVMAVVWGQNPPAYPAGDPVLDIKAGAFITLRQKGRLRGCIGHIIGNMPLGQTVVEMAAAAATQDPRFPPVKPEELKELEYEISVLTPLTACAPDQVRVGVDGLLIQMGGYSGLLLPQVPGELGWNREQFLEGLCQKAGLPAGAWRNPKARLYRFQALVF